MYVSTIRTYVPTCIRIRTVSAFIRTYMHIHTYVRTNISVEWSEHDTVERFLKPIYMEHFAKAFIEARITGQVLVALEEKHLQELGVNVVGDRIMMLDYLKVRTY